MLYVRFTTLLFSCRDEFNKTRHPFSVRDIFRNAPNVLKKKFRNLTATVILVRILQILARL